MGIIVTLAQGVEKIGEAGDTRVAGFFEAGNPGVEETGVLDGERLVRAEGWENASRETRGTADVITQVVRGIVGGADGGNAKLMQDAVSVQIVRSEKIVGALPNARGGRFVEQLVDAEIALQLQMGPMVERIAQRVRNRLRPGHEFLARRRLAGAVAFVDAIVA